MVDNETLRKLFRAFPAGIINRNLEFVACGKPAGGKSRG